MCVHGERRDSEMSVSALGERVAVSQLPNSKVSGLACAHTHTNKGSLSVGETASNLNLNFINSGESK